MTTHNATRSIYSLQSTYHIPNITQLPLQPKTCGV